jgi:hypothetical protein
MRNQSWDQWFDEVDAHISRVENQPKKLKLGWTIHEEIGICVINDYTITKISFDEPAGVSDETFELG